MIHEKLVKGGVMGGFCIGDLVRYYPVRKDNSEYQDAKVTDIFPEGLPSCREPLIKIEGKAGVILASHCDLLKPAGAP